VMLSNESKAKDLRALVRAGSARRGPYRAHEVPNIFDQTINWDLFGPAEEDMARYLAQLSWMFAKFRLKFLREAGWEGWPGHLADCLGDVTRWFVLRFLMQGRPLRQSPLVRLALRMGL